MYPRSAPDILSAASFTPADYLLAPPLVLLLGAWWLARKAGLVGERPGVTLTWPAP